jgi:hypothetical protein
MTTKTQVRIMAAAGCLLAIGTVLNFAGQYFAGQPATRLSLSAMVGNLFFAGFILYYAKKLHDKSQPDK